MRVVTDVLEVRRGEDDGGLQRRNFLRDMGLFFAGVVLGPALLTLLYRLTPSGMPLWLPDVGAMVLIAAMYLLLRWRWLALGVFVSASIWIVFIMWLTASVSPDW